MNSTILALALLTPAAPPAPAAPDVKDTVRNGLKWLAEKQKADGTWESLNDIMPTTTTATAGLALLMEGSTPSSGKYAPNIRKTVDWAVKNSADNGLLASKGMNEMYQYISSHSQALVFLACAYDVDDDTERRKKVAKVLEQAVAYLAAAQTTRGGWGFTAAGDPNGGGYDDSSSTATVLHALLAARKAGIDVPKALTDKGFAYLGRATNMQGGIIYSLTGNVVPRGNDGQPGISAMAAASALALDSRPGQFAGWVTNAGSAVTQQYFVSLKQGGGVYSLTQLLHVSRVAFALGDTGHRKLDPDARDAALLRWSDQRAKLFKTLKEMQGKDGSWNEVSFGPAYFSAQALVILQLDNDFLPAFSR